MFILGVTFIRYVYWTSLRFILFLHHSTDSGIYTMMFIEHWTSPRSALRCLFTQKDIPNIRIKIANDLVFQPKNSGMKHRVTDFRKVIFFSTSIFHPLPVFSIFFILPVFNFSCNAIFFCRIIKMTALFLDK